MKIRQARKIVRRLRMWTIIRKQRRTPRYRTSTLGSASRRVFRHRVDRYAFWVATLDLFESKKAT